MLRKVFCKGGTRMRETVLIESRNNETVRNYAKLTDKKYRSREQSFLCDGAKLFAEAVAAGARIEAVLLLAGRENPIIADTLARMRTPELYKDTRLFSLTPPVFDKLCNEKSPDGVITVIKCLDNFRKVYKIERNDAEAMRGEKLMLLSSVRDPGNLGTIVRSAAAFGFDRLILSDDCADLYHPRTLRGAMGALFRMRADVVTDFASAVPALRASGRRVYAAELRDGALSVDEAKPTAADCFVIGNEGHGIPPEISALCTGSVYIPIAPTSESLNAATAASILAYIQR